MTEASGQPSAVSRQDEGAAERVAGQRAETLLGRAGKPTSLTRDALRQLWRNPGAVAGACVLGAIVLITIFSSVFSPYDPVAQDTRAIRQAPSGDHLFGTDNFGR